MADQTALVDHYIATWNERDAGRRKALIASTWTERATYLDPALRAEGHSGIDTMVKSVHERFPGHLFRRTSEVDMHHDRLRFAWELGPEGGAAIVKGIDFGTVSGDRLDSVTGFFTQVPQ